MTTYTLSIRLMGSIRTYAKLASKVTKIPPPIKVQKRKKKDLVPMPIFQYPLSRPSDRRLYAWGLANHGALGTLGRTRREDDFDFIAKPSRLYFAEHYQVIDVACGYGFTLIGVKSQDHNIVYGTGINTDSQLGFVEKDKRLKTAKADIIPVPRAIPLAIKNNSTTLLGLAAGRAHSLILTCEGVFIFGNNAYGQCGRCIIENENYYYSRAVNHIKDIRGDKITGVATGQDHSLLLTEKGEVYAFGWGADGQTGLGHYETEWRPSLVQGELAGEKIIKVSCVADCVLALSESGKVYGWGNSEYGQLPINMDNYQVNTPTELSNCVDHGKIIDIATGGSFCMLLTDSGDVYVWGFGILGFGPNVIRESKPTLIPNTLFGRNPYQPDIKVTKIFCGMSQMAAITNTGDMYTWGRNKWGSLGLGHRKDQFFPLKVSIGAEVLKVAASIDHAVALCKPYI